MKDNDAWSLYWKGKPLNSCISNEYKEDQLILERCWTGFIDDVDKHSKVIDLATGNGSVLMCLASHRSDLEYIGVDYAEVSPESHFVGKLNDCVSFITKTDIADLPIESETVDAITSQFGFEYSSVFESANEMLRVLKPEGKFQLILHHEDGEILRSSARRKQEIDLLLLSGGIITTAKAYIDGQVSLLPLEQAGKSFITNNEGLLSEGVSGQVFTMINQIIELKESNADVNDIRVIFETLHVRLVAESSRLSQLAKAALSQDDVEQIMSHLSEGLCQVDVDVIKPYKATEQILAWKLSGKKVARTQSND